MKSSPYNNWLVVWNIFYCSIQFGMSSSQLTSIFFRGIATTNQNMLINYISYIQNNHQPIHVSTILNVIFHMKIGQSHNPSGCGSLHGPIQFCWYTVYPIFKETREDQWSMWVGRITRDLPAHGLTDEVLFWMR
jgi:hypothetical protein